MLFSVSRWKTWPATRHSAALSLRSSSTSCSSSLTMVMTEGCSGRERTRFVWSRKWIRRADISFQATSSSLRLLLDCRQSLLTAPGKNDACPFRLSRCKKKTRMTTGRCNLSENLQAVFYDRSCCSPRAFSVGIKTTWLSFLCRV